MKVLIACEESQTICKAIRANGHAAFSCDLQECSGGHSEWHIKGDCPYPGIAKAIADQWAPPEF